MHFLIDGHNLIGKLQDISLQDPDDEIKLVFKLRKWASRSRKRRVTVIFDRGLPGGIDKGLSSGKIKVVFASGSGTADSLLQNRIRKAQNASEYTLVSSDLRIIRTAEARKMPVVRSEDFANSLQNEQEKREQGTVADPAENPQLSAGELEMWLDLFDAAGDKE